MDETLRKSALDYHRLPRPGKIAITSTKPLYNQRDLALAYSPGVAAACNDIPEHTRSKNSSRTSYATTRLTTHNTTHQVGVATTDGIRPRSNARSVGQWHGYMRPAPE